MQQKKTVLLLGSYGQTNIGDDLLMWNYLTLLRDRGFNKIYVNANTKDNIPAPIRQAFPGLVVVPTYGTKLLDWVRLLGRIDCVVYGGGTVYKELYGSTGRGKYSVIWRIMVFNLVARIRGARVQHLHIGIGELRSWLGKTITRIALLTSERTIFRDKESYAFARGPLRLPQKSICQAADGLFVGLERWQKPWHAATLPRRKNKWVVGVNVLSDIPDWVDRDLYLVAVRSFITDLLAGGAFVVLVPFQHAFNSNNDLDFMRREIVPHLPLPHKFKLVEHIPIDQVVSYFKQLDVFVGMRFHSLLLATVTGTPYVGIAYDTKCQRFMEEANYPYHVPLAGMQADDLHGAYKALVTNIPKVPTMLARITAMYKQKGQQCLEPDF